MKRIAILIPILAIAAIVNAEPFVSETESTIGGQEKIVVQKNECLLVALNCPDKMDTSQQRIDSLQSEINKGTAVYTEEELGILNQKLNDAYENQRESIGSY